MVFLGLILAAVAIVAAVGVLLDNSEPVTISVFGQAAPGITEGELFVGGMTVAAAFILGCILVVGGVRRSRRMHAELDDLRENREMYIEALEREKDKLQREAAQNRAAPGPMSDPGPAPGPTSGPIPTDDLGTRVASGGGSDFFRRESSV